MYVLLSPAKKMAAPDRDAPLTTPAFPKETDALIRIMREKSPADLRALMGISENLALLNAERYQDFGTERSKAEAAAAALTFAGDTYQGFDGNTLNDDTLQYAQRHLGILSGLYGLLSPLDAIEPYRLEMGTKLATPRGKSLYDFWGESIAEEINRRVADIGGSHIVNLASKEYFNAVSMGTLKVPVITPVFKDVRKGKAKIISFLAKRARGSMARYIVTNRISTPDELKSFEIGGYQFDATSSDAQHLVFIRQEGVST